MPQKSGSKKSADDNPSAFKHMINGALLKRMAGAIKASYPDFDSKSFISSAAKELESLEMKQRVRLVRETLRSHLPSDYTKAIKILLASIEGDSLKGFDFWPYTDFVQTYGLDHFDESMKALRRMTQVFTAEFAVRPFLAKMPDQTFARLEAWAEDSNTHVRRWVSEGTRPRLPWGERLNVLIKDPSPTLALLEKLKYDPELYVRKSVANHLNDIAKDHPALVVKVLREWKKECPEEHKAKIAWIQKHALRTLIKKGDPAALELMGATANAAIEVKGLALDKKTYRVGDAISFRFELASKSKNVQELIIDYVVHHVKANKERVPKVFKLKRVSLPAKATLEISKRHSLKAVTTRRYYPGLHALEIQVNGRILSRVEWSLKI